MTLLVINNSRTETAIEVPLESRRYTLSAVPLRNGDVELNGAALKVDGSGDLPPIEGAATAAGSVSFAPVTITFLTVEQSGNSACRGRKQALDDFIGMRRFGDGVLRPRSTVDGIGGNPLLRVGCPKNTFTASEDMTHDFREEQGSQSPFPKTARTWSPATSLSPNRPSRRTPRTGPRRQEFGRRESRNLCAVPLRGASQTKPFCDGLTLEWFSGTETAVGTLTLDQAKLLDGPILQLTNRRKPLRVRAFLRPERQCLESGFADRRWRSPHHVLLRQVERMSLGTSGGPGTKSPVNPSNMRCRYRSA